MQVGGTDGRHMAWRERLSSDTGNPKALRGQHPHFPDGNTKARAGGDSPEVTQQDDEESRPEFLPEHGHVLRLTVANAARVFHDADRPDV